jgi:RNA polymerase sigma-70 factor (ECF subfamily)
MMFLPLILAIQAPAGDVELVTRLQTRDPQALAELYDRYGRCILLILRVVRDAAIAEDLVQETFLRVWNRAQISTRKGSDRPVAAGGGPNRAIDPPLGWQAERDSRDRPSVALHGQGRPALSDRRAA